MTEKIHAVTIPKWGIEMLEGTVVEWHSQEGGNITAGDELIDIETDKIVNTLEAPVSGVLRRRLADKGATLKVGALLGVIAPAEVDDKAIEDFIAAFGPAKPVADDQSADNEEAAVSSTPPATAPAETAAAAAPSRRVRVSPAAKQRARELGVDINQVKGSGRRISPQDVERFAQQHATPAAATPPETAYEAEPLSATRKTIARRLVEAKQQVPHFYLSIDIDMEAALERREEINAGASAKISVNDIAMRATVLCLQAMPDLNAHLVDEEIRRFRAVNLAMAVATERGIITPVIHAAEGLTLPELAAQAADQGERAREASLKKEDLEGGTFTISNLGMYGVNAFQAIINPPQVAILALGACAERAVAANGKASVARRMSATLSCDHRAVDGAMGAQFLAKFKAILERPADL